MKYLKRFESIFGAAEPKQITTSEWSRKVRSGKDFFTKSEHKTLIDLMEKSGRENLTQDEWDNLGWSEKLHNFVIGLTFLTYYIGSGDVNPVPIEVHLQKCPDEWFMVSFYQDDYGDYEGNMYDTYEEYYECDGFDSVLNLLKIQ
jgi:hypothetical protein